MSHWYGDFRAAFFGHWVAAGLPAPRREGRGRHVNGRPCELPPVIAERLAGLTETALRPALLADVYGFGQLVGNACADLFAARAAGSAARIDWCGRFNLGISLFDYVCDEVAADPRRTIAALPAFAMFTGERAADPQAAGALGETLDWLAAGLLGELAEELGRPRASHRRTGLWRALDRMFAAELAVATVPSRLGTDPGAVQAQLRIKSSEPFRVMAEWIARGGARVSTRRAAHFGRALGDCFWLVDDARDVWEDLDAGRWNYFLAAASVLDPGLALEAPSPVLEARLVALWRRHRVAHNAARGCVRRFTRALHGLGASRARTELWSGRLVDAMAQWSR